MWRTECTRLLRHCIDDLGTTYDFEDDRLQELLLVAAQFIQIEMKFDNTYTVDLDQLKLSPDPTEGTKDNSFINLMVIKAACIVDRTRAKRAIDNNIDIQDVGTRISFKQSDPNLRMLDINWCKEYEKAKKEHITGSGIPGLAVMSPFRVESYGPDDRPTDYTTDPFR